MEAKFENSSKLFSVKATCKKLGIGAHTLRAWEARYRAVIPARSATGQRLYTADNIDRLEKILRLVNHGHSVGVVAKLDEPSLDELVMNALGGAAAKNSNGQTVPEIVDDLHDGLRSFDLSQVAELLEQRRLALGTRFFALEVLVPVLRWIGSQIDQGELSIAHEHAVSAVLRDQIYKSLQYGAASHDTKKSPHFVLATPEDDLHEFGILISAALLSHHNIPNHLLGANLPAEALAIAVQAIKGDVILLGNADVPEDERKISFEDYLRQLDRLIPKDIAIWIGGNGKIPHLRSVMPARDHRYINSLAELDALIAGLASTNQPKKVK